MVHDDYERDYLKEIVYLQEQILELEMDTRDLMNEIRREVARITVTKEITKQHDGEIRSELLPF